MKKLFAFFLFGTLLSIAAFADSFTALGGYVRPRGHSDVFQVNEAETTFRVNDLDGFGGSFRYDWFLGNFINLSGGTSFYYDSTTVQDVDFVQLNGQPIFRDIRFEIVPLEASLHLLPAGRNQPVIPYVGGGFGIYYWRYEEIGDFVLDRFGANPSIITGSAFSDGWDPGWHVEGGVQVPVSRSIAIVGEAKYWQAHGHLDVRGFDPAFNPIDLSGAQISGGVSIWF